MMRHHDRKLEAQLDAEYIQQERRFTKERHSSTRMPRDVPPVNAEIRKQQVLTPRDQDGIRTREGGLRGGGG